MSPARTRLALLGLLAVLAAALGGTVARRRARARRAAAPPASHRVDSPAQPQSFTCTCGAKYRTSGTGRHRVYWPEDASESDPVLGNACPNCGTPLPDEPAAA